MARLPRTAKPIRDASADWTHLNAVIPPIHRRDFTWVVAMRMTDGTRIDVFAHGWTNRELLLGDDGGVYRLTPSYRYKLDDDPAWAIEQALPHRHHWLEMGGYVSFDVGPEPWPEDEFGEQEPAYVERWRPRAMTDGDPDEVAVLAPDPAT